MPTGDKAQILFVLTSADKTLDGRPIGFYLEECAAPWSELKDYFTVVFASPAGGVAPLDQNSVEHCGDKEARALLDDSKFKYLIKNTHKLSNIKEEDYVAIFVVGGHGPMMDLAFDKEFAHLVEQFHTAGKPVAAVCHGPAALTQAKKNASDESILNGVQVTGFSNSEEAQTPYNDFVNILPFSLEDKLRELGGKYQKADDWAPKVCWDGQILTGQNPASARPLGKKLAEILREYGAVPVAKDYPDDI